jgi:hypothetical protein
MALMMKVVCTSETSVYFNNNTRRCIPESCHLFNITSLFVPVFMTNILHAFLSTPIRVTHSSQVNVIDLVSLVILLKVMIYEAFPSIMFISLSYFLCLRPQYYSYHFVLNRSAFSSLIIGDKVSLA